MNTQKLIKGGKVAVIVSPGYGAGWSTWNFEYGEDLVFDPVLAQMILDKRSVKELAAYVEATYPEAYTGGLENVEVEWVPEGSRFIINEYDGYESITIMGPDYGFIA